MRPWVWVFGLILFGYNAYILNWALPQYEIRMADFSTLYVAGKILLAGEPHRMYDLALQAQMQVSAPFRQLPLPFNHAPFESLLFAPLAMMKYASAFFTWDLVSLILLFVMTVRLAPYADSLGKSWALIFVLAMAYWPNVMVLVKGQDSILLALLLAEAYVQLKQGRDGRAGIFLALGLFKFHLVLPLVLCLAAARRWKLVKSFAETGAVLLAVSVAMVGGHGVAQYIELLRSLGREPLALYTRPELMPNLRGLIASGMGLQSAWGGAAIALASALVLWGALRKLPGEDNGLRLDLYYAGALAASFTVSYNTYQHDMAVMFPALVLVVNALPKVQAWAWRAVCAALILLLFAGPVSLQLMQRHALCLMCVPVVVFALMMPAGRSQAQAG
jgi:hypothetical protein